MSAAAAARVERVVAAVCAAAVRDAAAAGIMVVQGDAAAVALLERWLEHAGIVVERGRPPDVAEPRHASDALIAHPACRTELLLCGRLPLADLLPLGDLWASQVRALAGGWRGPAWLERLAAAAGGLAAVDGALMALVEERRPAAVAVAGLPAVAAAELLQRYAAGRWHRLRPRLVPKLAVRTLGIDLFD
jgi:hypothetical protein